MNIKGVSLTDIANYLFGGPKEVHKDPSIIYYPGPISGKYPPFLLINAKPDDPVVKQVANGFPHKRYGEGVIVAGRGGSVLEAIIGGIELLASVNSLSDNINDD